MRRAMGEMAMKIEKDEFNRRRLEQNRRILDTGLKGFQRFFALDTAAYAEGALSAPVKELMGLVASTVLRCNDCIQYHLQRCVEAGVPDKEIHEALNIAMIVGGSITIPHLRYAFEALEALSAGARGPRIEDPEEIGGTS